MSVQAATKSVTKDVGVTLLDAADEPVTGLVNTDVTVVYRKNGQTSFTTKVLLPGEFNEVGDGIYLITFTAGELNTAGFFRYVVTGSAFDRHEGDLVVINEQLSLNQHIVSLKAAFATLANVRDVDVLFDTVEQRLKQLDKRERDLTRRIELLKGQIAALRAL